MENNFAIKARGLIKKFDDFIAVNNISFKIERGEVFGFLGANGAGKSTTIRMLTGIITPTEGEAEVGGYNIYTEQEKLRKTIGYMSQRFSLYEDMTIRENLVFYGGLYGMSKLEMYEAHEHLYERLGIGEMKNRLVGSLPLGWKQRISLACSIQHNPQILFLDEPTGGVDPVSRRSFWNIIYDLSEKGVTIFVTTHYMDETEYCGRISIMHAGEILDIGSPFDLKQKYGMETIEDLFVYLVRKTDAEKN